MTERRGEYVPVAPPGAPVRRGIETLSTLDWEMIAAALGVHHVPREVVGRAASPTGRLGRRR